MAADGSGGLLEALLGSLTFQAMSHTLANNPEDRHLLQTLRGRLLAQLTFELGATARPTPHEPLRPAPQPATESVEPLSRYGVTATNPLPPPSPNPAPSTSNNGAAAPGALAAPTRPTTRDATAAPAVPIEYRDPPPHLPPASGGSLSSAGGGAWLTVGGNTTRVGSATGAGGQEPVKNDNKFNLLSPDVDAPHPTCYTAAAASPPRSTDPAPPRQPATAPTTPAPLPNGRQTVFLSTSSLPDDHKLRSLPAFFLLEHMKAIVRKAGAKDDGVVAAARLERGDLRGVVRGGEDGAEALTALTAVVAVVERTGARERRTVMVHFLPAGTGADELN